MAALQVKLMAAKLREVHGNIAAAARHFGVTRVAAWRFVHKHPQLLEVLHECRETMKDMAESVLYKGVLDGVEGQVRFFLGAQAKDRGYGQHNDMANTLTAEQAMAFVESVLLAAKEIIADQEKLQAYQNRVIALLPASRKAE